MMKRFMLATAMAPFLAFGIPWGASAAPEHSGDHHEISTEDKAAITDAHIAALKAGLKLTPAQEKNWPALEAVLRDVAKARAARMAEWHEKAKEHHEHPDLIENLRQGAKAMTERAGELEKIADAAKPLYDTLDEAQKRRFGMLFHVMARMHGHMGHMGNMGHMDQHSDDQD